MLPQLRPSSYGEMPARRRPPGPTSQGRDIEGEAYLTDRAWSSRLGAFRGCPSWEEAEGGNWLDGSGARHPGGGRVCRGLWGGREGSSPHSPEHLKPLAIPDMG